MTLSIHWRECLNKPLMDRNDGLSPAIQFHGKRPIVLGLSLRFVTASAVRGR